MLRPLTPDGKRPKNKDELTQGERHILDRQRQSDEHLKRNLDTQRERRKYR